jgi:thioredoxin 1
MSHPSVLAVNDLNFEEVVLKSKEPVLVDFGAVWCSPCKVLEPVVEKMAMEAGGKFKVAKVDIDESPATAAKYGIRGVPTVIAFHDGQRVAQHVGVANQAKLLALLPST